MSSIDQQTFEELVEISPNAIYLRVDDWLVDFSSYKIGDTFKGFVTYVLDSDMKLCFIKNMTK